MTIHTATATRTAAGLQALCRQPAVPMVPRTRVATLPSLSTDTVSLRQASPIAHVSLCEAEGVFDPATGGWDPEALPACSNRTDRVIGLNQPGGPQVDAAALADPTAYTMAAAERQRRSQPKDTGYVVGAVIKPVLGQILSKPKTDDGVTQMPPDLVKRIESYLQPGDIILQGTNADMRSGDRSLFLHGMIYLGRNQEGQGYIVHAIAQKHQTAQGDLIPAVRLSTYEDGMQRDLPGNDRVAVLRPTSMSQADYNRLVTFAVGEVGKPYDFAFNGNDDSRYYCTELVAKELEYLDPEANVTPDPGLPLPMFTDRSIRQAQVKGLLQPVLTINPRPDRRPS
jgi:hypothetical protein